VDGSCDGRFTPPLGRVIPDGNCEALFPNDGRLPEEGRLLDGTRPALGRFTAPVEGRVTAPVDGRETLPVDGRETLPVDGRETLPVDGRETLPVDGRE
jgi:hypothetical protein